MKMTINRKDGSVHLFEGSVEEWVLLQSKLGDLDKPKSSVSYSTPLRHPNWIGYNNPIAWHELLPDSVDGMKVDAIIKRIQVYSAEPTLVDCKLRDVNNGELITVNADRMMRKTAERAGKYLRSLYGQDVTITWSIK